jgi:ABC-type branched-subunit amino acid transport system ATPase component
MAVLEFVGLAVLKDNEAGSLPYGTRKLIDIARAIVAGPRLLLLDEPTSGLDAAEQSSVAHMLLELSRTTPVTLLVVEHHMEIVRNVARKVVGLQGGMVLATGTPEEVLDSDIFRAAIVGGRSGEE